MRFTVCELPTGLLDGEYSFSPDQMMLTYICMDGFTLKGSPVRNCSKEGLGWDGTDPTCGT